MTQLPDTIQDILGMQSKQAATAEGGCITKDPTKLSSSKTAQNSTSAAKLQSGNGKNSVKATPPPRPVHGPGKIVRVDLEVASKKAKH